MIQVQVPGRVYRSRVWIGIDFALKGVEILVIFFETQLNFLFMEAGLNLVVVTEAVLRGILIVSSEGGHGAPFFSVGLREPGLLAGLDYF